MKKYSAADLAILIIAGGVGWIMFSGGVSMIIRGSTTPSPELIRVRELLFGLAGTALGGILVKQGQIKSDNKNEDKNT